MKLPVSNKAQAARKIVGVHFLLSALTLFYFLTKSTLTNWKFFIPLYIISLLSSFLYIRKQNIKKATLLENIIRLEYNDRIIDIPLCQIQKISSSLNYYIKLNGKFSLLYKLDLNKSYQFGKAIFLEFYKKEKIGIDPIEVSKLKERITNIG